MESKEALIAELAGEYMEYIEEIAGAGHEEIVVSLINHVHAIVTESDTPVLQLKYLDEDGGISDTPLDDEESIDIGGQQYKYRRKDVPKKKNKNFPTLSEDLNTDIEDALGFVYDVFEDVTYALESSEGDNELLKLELEKTKKHDRHMTSQAEKLYKLNEYLSIQLRDSQETLAEVFKNGDGQDEVDEDENTEDLEGDTE